MTGRRPRRDRLADGLIGSADLFDLCAVEVMRQQAALTPLVRSTRLQRYWH